MELNGFDLNVRPQTDFNLFVNGKWLKENPIPSKYTRWGTFEVLHEENLEKIKKLVEEADGYFEKVKILYNSAIDHEKLNLEGNQPVKKYVDMIESCKTKTELWNVLSYLYVKGLSGIFVFFPSEDAKDSDIVVPYLGSGGIGLPDRDYYFDEDKEEIRSKYKNYLRKLFNLYYNDNSYDEIVVDIYNLEEKLAEKIYTRVEKRDPEKNYNKMTLYDLKSRFNLDFSSFFDTITNGMEIPYVIVDNPEVFIFKLHKSNIVKHPFFKLFSISFLFLLS